MHKLIEQRKLARYVVTISVAVLIVWFVIKALSQWSWVFSGMITIVLVFSFCVVNQKIPRLSAWLSVGLSWLALSWLLSALTNWPWWASLPITGLLSYLVLNGYVAKMKKHNTPKNEDIE